jgi:TPR repeat protein
MDRQTLTIGAALLAVVVVGLGIMFFLSGDSTDEPAPITGPGSASEARSAIAEIQQARARAETEAPAAPQPRLIERPESAGSDSQSTGAGAVTPEPVAAVPTGADAQLDEAYQEAKAFIDDGQYDDGQVMLFFLARQGHAQAAFDLASLYDPLQNPDGNTPLGEPDPFQAYKNYDIAASGGMAEATERLDALYEWAQQAADGGNDEAERLLLQWEQ